MKKLLIVAGIVLALFAAIVVAVSFLPESPDRLENSVTNPRPIGARALGQVLAANGVNVAQVTHLDQAVTAPAQSTLAVIVSAPLPTGAIEKLNQTPADVVLVYSGDFRTTDIRSLTEGQVEAQPRGLVLANPRADCIDPDAQAAETITGDAMYGLTGSSSRVVTCFTDDVERSLYADLQTSRHRVTVIAGSLWLKNSTITADGNAALALRVLGRHDRLTWYLPASDAGGATVQEVGQVDNFALLPPWARSVFAVMLVAGAAAALWQGRRFGALVREPLPVEVPASEASSGLARLYRQAGARGHAAAALRAATIQRAAARVGLSPTDPPDSVINQLAHASGEDPGVLQALLYGPPPTTDASLAELAATLTDLDRKLSSR